MCACILFPSMPPASVTCPFHSICVLCLALLRAVSFIYGVVCIYRACCLSAILIMHVCACVSLLLLRSVCVFAAFPACHDEQEPCMRVRRVGELHKLPQCIRCMSSTVR